MATLITLSSFDLINRFAVDEVIEPDFDDAELELATMASQFHDNTEAEVA